MKSGHLKVTDPRELAALIDHTYLKSDGDSSAIERVCAEAIEYGFCSVAINPAEIETAARLLVNSSVKVCAAISFPLGQNTLAVKRFEIQDAISRGAAEVDMVINQRLLARAIAVDPSSSKELLNQEALDQLRAEIVALVETAKPQGVTSKIILECCNLNLRQKVVVCQLAKELGCDFVKTSTGMASGGATVEDIKLMREIVGNHLGVKASGGVRNLAQALDLIKAGANRIGTSNGVQIIQELISNQPAVKLQPEQTKDSGINY